MIFADKTGNALGELGFVAMEILFIGNPKRLDQAHSLAFLPGQIELDVECRAPVSQQVQAILPIHFNVF